MAAELRISYAEMQTRQYTELRGAPLKVYLTLRGYANFETGRVAMADSFIAVATGLTTRQIRWHIRKLISLKRIELKFRGLGRIYSIYIVHKFAGPMDERIKKLLDAKLGGVIFYPSEGQENTPLSGTKLPLSGVENYHKNSRSKTDRDKTVSRNGTEPDAQGGGESAAGGSRSDVEPAIDGSVAIFLDNCGVKDPKKTALSRIASLADCKMAKAQHHLLMAKAKKQPLGRNVGHFIRTLEGRIEDGLKQLGSNPTGNRNTRPGVNPKGAGALSDGEAVVGAAARPANGLVGGRISAEEREKRELAAIDADLKRKREASARSDGQPRARNLL